MSIFLLKVYIRNKIRKGALKSVPFKNYHVLFLDYVDAIPTSSPALVAIAITKYVAIVRESYSASHVNDRGV